MSHIPIKELKALAKRRHLTHVIVWAFDEGKEQHVATFGRSVEDCAQAADFGNKLKDALGWPESLHAQPSRVRALLKRINDLETELGKR